MGEKTIFAKRLHECREKRGLSQAKLARAAGITPQSLSAYEKAEKGGRKGKNPTIESAVALADALHTSLDWLCGRGINPDERKYHTYGELIRSILPLCDGYEKYVTIKTLTFHDAKSQKAFLFDRVVTDFLDRWQKMKDVCSQEEMVTPVFDPWLAEQLNEMDQLLIYPRGFEALPDEFDE